MSSRRVIDITIVDRDVPLEFEIREMAATELEEWIMRALLALLGSGVKVDMSGGIGSAASTLSEVGLEALAGLDFERIKPLMEQLLNCCYRKIGDAREKVTTATANAYINDVATLLKLRVEAFKVNLNFTGSGVPSTSQGSVNIGKPQGR